MKRSRFSESQIIKALKEQQQGRSVLENLPIFGNRQEYFLLLNHFYTKFAQQKTSIKNEPPPII